MSLIAPALALTLAWEGGWSNDPADPGGETYAGISRRDWPGWPGWSQDALLRAGGQTAAIQAWVQTFYHDHFWEPLHADSWPSQSLANSVFDCAVNQGLETAVKALQRALGPSAGPEDGLVGPMTLRALYEAPSGLLGAFGWERLKLYAETVAAKPSLVRFLPGWLRRTLSYAPQTQVGCQEHAYSLGLGSTRRT